MHKSELDTIGIIGVGNMGGAILSQSLEHKKQNFIIVEKDKLKEAFACMTYRVRAAKDISDLTHKAGVIIIAVKPQDIDVVLEGLSKGIQSLRNPDILIISIAAGIKTEYIEAKILDKVRVIRAMPNMPSAIGEGITALVKGRFATEKDLKTVERIFKTLGETITLSKEGLIDVVTAISGSGPAYMFFIFSSILNMAKALGLDSKSANKLIYNTVIGSMDMLKKNKFDAKTLISKVASKGGTTEAALKVFNERGLEMILVDAIRSAHRRSKELSRA
ncbi:MAG: pyrroline-5-carboxylate reductase [Candidatus Omnitrophica bacterium]|nr:pyrroline-5-carboxylate reductase [Candidatus Omnitrophota bacterium]